MIYYTQPCNNDVRKIIDEKDYLGVIITPSSSSTLNEGWDIIADNGCFSDKWDKDIWFSWICNLHKKNIKPRFVVCPDVVDLSGLNETHFETLELWLEWSPKIRELGFSPAFVLQRGAKCDNIPMDAEYLFIGGDTDFKLGYDAESICKEYSQDKWIHMGRVNSCKRIALANSWGCKSVDGTYVVFNPTKNIASIVNWFENNFEVSQKGEKNNASKLTQSLVDEIRLRYSSEKISVRKLSKQYNISKTQINDIINYKYWNV